MKSVLISINPKWCELIANGKKTVEVRKTRPKTNLPFKVYIYCTNSKTIGDFILCKSEENAKLFGCNTAKGINKGFAEAEDIQLKGKVIGEFVCDRIEEIGFSPYNHGEYICKDQSFIEQSCIPFCEMFNYLGDGYGYGWHISDLVIYDKPKELNEFKRWVDRSKEQRYHENMLYLQRPPQSWVYVEGGDGMTDQELKAEKADVMYFKRQIKSEAVREFAKKLKATPLRFRVDHIRLINEPPESKMVLFVDDSDIDNLVEEMVGDQK